MCKLLKRLLYSIHTDIEYIYGRYYVQTYIGFDNYPYKTTIFDEYSKERVDQEILKQTEEVSIIRKNLHNC